LQVVGFSVLRAGKWKWKLIRRSSREAPGIYTAIVKVLCTNPTNKQKNLSNSSKLCAYA